MLKTVRMLMITLLSLFSFFSFLFCFEDIQNEFRILNWNSDYNTPRAIFSKGLDLVPGRPLPRKYLRTTENIVQRVRFVRCR